MKSLTTLALSLALTMSPVVNANTPVPSSSINDVLELCDADIDLACEGYILGVKDSVIENHQACITEENDPTVVIVHALNIMVNRNKDAGDMPAAYAIRRVYSQMAACE